MALSALFALDAFAGGFVVQSLLAYWFYLRFGADAGLLGGIFRRQRAGGDFRLAPHGWQHGLG